jgi:hypothetical protein
MDEPLEREIELDERDELDLLVDDEDCGGGHALE